MILKNINSFFILFVCFLLSSCATKPWTDPLETSEADSIKLLVDSIIASETSCGETLEGDLTLLYQNPLGKKTVAGFFQFSMPSAYKFVMTNPLGQPIIVVAGNQASFQVINTLRHSYLAGSVRSFGLRSDIPRYLLQGDWGAWITARNRQQSPEIIDIRSDKDSRGVWLTFQNKELDGLNHLLLDREKGLFLDRILEDGYGKTVAKITYDNWVNLAGCRQPLEIHITGLDYGTDIQLKLSNVLLTREKKNYQLDIPKGYNQQYLP